MKLFILFLVAFLEATAVLQITYGFFKATEVTQASWDAGSDSLSITLK